MAVADRSPSRAHAPLLARRPAQAFDGGSFAGWRRKLRPAVRRALGLHLMPRIDEPPRARTVWTRAIPEGTVTRLELSLEPGVSAPVYLCLPHEPTDRVFVCLQGHTTGMHNSIAVAADDERTRIEVPGDRDLALQCLRRGLAALALEQRSLGERRETVQERRSFHGDCHDAAMRALLLGRTLLGERVFDLARVVTWLRAGRRPRFRWVGGLGHSGGGTVVLHAAGAGVRLDAAIVSGAFCTIRRSIATIHHCVDNYVPGMALLADTADVLGLAAPMPTVIVAGKDDAIFPLGGARAAFRQLHRIHAAAGTAGSARLVVGPEGHRFYAELAFSALRRCTT